MKNAGYSGFVVAVDLRVFQITGNLNAIRMSGC